jgi:hypothetical protein
MVVHRARRAPRADHRRTLPSSPIDFYPAGHAGDSGATEVGFPGDVEKLHDPIWGGVGLWEELMFQQLEDGEVVVIVMLPPPCPN